MARRSALTLLVTAAAVIALAGWSKDLATVVVMPGLLLAFIPPDMSGGPSWATGFMLAQSSDQHSVP